LPIDERTFVADAASMVNEMLSQKPGLPFERARVEEHVAGGRKRIDFLLSLKSGNKKFLTGEVKMPDRPGGTSPHDHLLVEDAFEKASRHGSEYYFTWNVREFLLFKTHMAGVPYMDRLVQEYSDVAPNTRNSEDTDRADVKQAVRDFWTRFLDDLAGFAAGKPIRNLPLDRRFVRRLEAALDAPVTLTEAAIADLRPKDSSFRSRIDTWMRDQGWEVSNQSDALRANIGRAARLTCYVQLNRLVFYEVTRRHFQQLPPLCRPPKGTLPVAYREALSSQLKEAIQASHDYETIFATDDETGGELPFLHSGSTDAWAVVVEDVEQFDLTRIDYDVIGAMYQALIGPAERRRYGQYFTSVEVVDLINAFCIRKPDAQVLDPACGGGTFLVRAYARKRTLYEKAGTPANHQSLLSEIGGIDIAAFPAQLSTINLAVRYLTAEPNYPRVFRKDFFLTDPKQPVAILPVGRQNGRPVPTKITIAEMDAIVGNPPYIRQEDIGDKQKARLRALAKKAGAALSGRSDIYAFFFPHAANFLKKDGYIGLVTSVGWLDTGYGEDLQRYFLDNFKVIAVMESQVEKWFEDARVTTMVTILQREERKPRRASNLVRFVQLRKPLAEIYSHVLKGKPSTDDEKTRQGDMDAIRGLIEETDSDTETDYWRMRVVPQGDLVPGKWGRYIRAPQVYFDLLRMGKGRLVLLSELAEIRRGFTTGADRFYCVRDVTEEETEKASNPDEFKTKWGISQSETGNVRIIRDGEDGHHLVEARFLEPEFHRLTEAKRPIVSAKDVSKHVINASVPRGQLRGTHFARYVEFAEKRGWNTGATIQARARTQPWYDLRLRLKSERAQMFWPKAQQYRHLVPWNADQLPANANLYDVWAREPIQARVLWAILNSSIVALLKQHAGRSAGIEGDLKTEVEDVDAMQVPDARLVNEALATRLVNACVKLSNHDSARFLYEEFDLRERQNLDDAVLEMMGIGNRAERDRLRNELYGTLRSLIKTTREREIIAQQDRSRTGRSGDLSTSAIADELWDGAMEDIDLHQFPDDFVHNRAALEEFDLPSGPVQVGRAMMDTGRDLRSGTARFGGSKGEVIEFGHAARAEFAEILVRTGHGGRIGIPREKEAEAACTSYRKYEAELESRFLELAKERTRDERRQAAIARHLLQKARTWRRE